MKKEERNYFIYSNVRANVAYKSFFLFLTRVVVYYGKVKKAFPCGGVS